MTCVRRIEPDDDVACFCCGEPELDAWVHLRALKAEAQADAVVFVAVDREHPHRIQALFSLSPHAVALREARGALSRNAPDPVPAILLGRLAVDERFQGSGLGSRMLSTAIELALRMRRNGGGRALVVDPKNERVAQWYSRAGFRPMREGSRLYLMLRG